MRLFGTVLPYAGFRTKFFDDIPSMPVALQKTLLNRLRGLPVRYKTEDIEFISVSAFTLGWFNIYLNFSYAITPYFNWEK